MTIDIPQCQFCRHFHDDREDGNFCDAFPDGTGIPAEIILNQFDHRQPHDGDHGIQFDALPDEHHPFEETE